MKHAALNLAVGSSADLFHNGSQLGVLLTVAYMFVIAAGLGPRFGVAFKISKEREQKTRKFTACQSIFPDGSDNKVCQNRKAKEIRIGIVILTPNFVSLYDQ